MSTCQPINNLHPTLHSPGAPRLQPVLLFLLLFHFLSHRTPVLIFTFSVFFRYPLFLILFSPSHFRIVLYGQPNYRPRFIFSHGRRSCLVPSWPSSLRSFRPYRSDITKACSSTRETFIYLWTECFLRKSIAVDRYRRFQANHLFFVFFYLAHLIPVTFQIKNNFIFI